MNLSQYALTHKSIVLLVTTLLVLFGLYTYATAPRKEDPQFVIRDSILITAWPGGKADEVERLVTDPLETALAGIAAVRKLDSTSYVGVSVIQITIADSEIDAGAVWDKVRREVTLVEPRLPIGCLPPYLNDHISQAAVLMLALYQDPATFDRHRYTPRELEDFAKALRDRIMDLRPMAGDVPDPSRRSYAERVDLYGVNEEVVYIETDLGRWSQLGLTTAHLAALLRLRNVVVSGGTIDTNRAKFPVQTSSQFDAVEEIERVVLDRVMSGPENRKLSGLEGLVARAAASDDADLPVPAALMQGVPVYLKDLGLNVVRSYRDPPTSLTRFSDTEQSYDCVVVSFTMKDGVNIGDMSAAVDALLKEAPRSFLAPDILVAKAGDQPTAVQKKVDEVSSNVVSSIVVVVLVLIVMAGLRTSLIATIAIPAIMLIAIGLMRFWGIAIEQISLAALIVSLGILVDNTIQVCDNIQKFLDQGKKPFDAAIQGTKEIAFPLLIATGTILAAFLPMTVALEGSMREYVFSLPVVVSIALAAGWVFAMTVTTIMAVKLLKPKKKKAAKSAAGGTSFFQKLCLGAIGQKWITLAVAYGLLVVSLLLPVPSSFFPLSDRNQFIVDVYLPESAPIHRTSEVAGRVERLIRALDRKTYVDGRWVDLEKTEGRLTSMCAFVGSGGPFLYAGLYPKADSSNYAGIWVNTVNGDQVSSLIADIRQASTAGLGEPGTDGYLQPIAGARVVPQNLVLGVPVISPIDVRILGPRLGSEDVLRRYGARVKEVLRDTGLVWDVHDSWGEYGRQLDVTLDEDRANLAGVTNASVLMSMNAYYSGHYVTAFRDGDRQIPVMLRLSPSERQSLDGIAALHVEGLSGKVPLNSVAEVTQSWQPAKIQRYQRQRSMSVRCRPEAGILYSEVLAVAAGGLDAIAAELPPGYRIEQGGVKEEADKGARMNGKALMIGGILIFVLLVIQFNSLIKPLMILLTLPLAAGGGMFGLFLMGLPLGFMEVVGFIALFGIVLSASILLIEFSEILIKRKVAAGEGLAASGEKSYCGLRREVFRDCLAAATQQRLKPILMTTLTTVGGLVSLMFAGGPLFKGLATAIVIGLSLGTFFTLFVLPAIFAIFVENFGLNIAATAPVQGSPPRETEG